jgi:hypothetical protein
MVTHRARRLYIAIAVGVIALLVPGLAGAANPAAAKKKHKADITVKAAVVGTSGNSTTVAGTLSGRPTGEGAVVYKTKPSGANLAATYTAFAKAGTVRGTTLVTLAAQPDGTTSFTGTLQVKGGTGRYRGAKGKDLKIVGTLANNIFTFQITGTVRY